MLDRVPDAPRCELGTLGFRDVLGGGWPSELAARVRQAAAEGRSVLLVGRTDAFGPRALNRSLGLQYAVQAARGASAALGLDLSVFSCASVGEEGLPEPGVEVFSWEAPPVRAVGSGRVTILEPAGNSASGGRFWSFWELGGAPVLWGAASAQGALVWELNRFASPVSLPLSAAATQAALGVWYPPGEAETASVEHPALRAEPSLRLRFEPLESWAVRLTGSVPAGYGDPTVWVCGIPYPAAQGADGHFTVDAALLGRNNRAFLQAVDPYGRAAFGPWVDLPDGEGTQPDALAVLVWEGKDTDLDLAAWSGTRRTDPQDPDGAFSPRAVPGVRLLFDGDGSRPASALYLRGGADLELEVNCYSDLGGTGSVAWLYVVFHPGDPLRQRGKVLGPRQLSGRAVELRWPALTWKGD